MGSKVHCTYVTPGRGKQRTTPLTIAYSAECKEIQKSNRPSGFFPVLVVLFVFSYAILTTLVVEQGRTIESQRALIREMLQDSNQLAALKGQMAQDKAKKTQSKTEAPDPATEQQQPTGPAASGKPAGKAMKDIPQRPESDLQDIRRMTHIV
jgi:hypothetical protein